MSDDSQHQLLPWFVNGTLEPAEAEAFRRHLDGCADCRREMEFLKQVRETAEREGSALLSAHPDAERLVDFADGRLDEPEAREIRAHVALCPSCGLESRWVRGEQVAGVPPRSVPGGPERSFATGRQRALWASAAAVLLLAASIVFFGVRDQAPSVPRTFHLTGAERSTGVQLLRFDCGRPMVLLFPVELPATAFPVTVELVDEGDRAVLRETDIPRSLLTEDLYLSIAVPETSCRAGSYQVRVSPSAGESPAEFLFRIESP